MTVYLYIWVVTVAGMGHWQKDGEFHNRPACMRAASELGLTPAKSQSKIPLYKCVPNGKR